MVLTWFELFPCCCCKLEEFVRRLRGVLSLSVSETDALESLSGSLRISIGEVFARFLFLDNAGCCSGGSLGVGGCGGGSLGAGGRGDGFLGARGRGGGFLGARGCGGGSLGVGGCGEGSGSWFVDGFGASAGNFFRVIPKSAAVCVGVHLSRNVWRHLRMRCRVLAEGLGSLTL